MDNRKIINSRPRFPRKFSPHRLFFTWEIHYACNYKCTYCHAPKPWQPETKKGVYLGVEEWLKIWGKIFQNYGSCRILIGGGEPSSYPSFSELLIGLTKMHFIEVCTNLSLDVRPIVKHINPRYIKVSSSLHPEFADIDQFIDKLKILKSSGFDTMVNFVPWPPLLGKMKEYKERVEAVGVQFVLQPYIGEYQGRQYPGGYTDSEKEYFNVFNDDCNLSTLNFKVEDEKGEKKSGKTKGKLCRMGQNYGFIHADGSVSRCCRDHSFSLGNITDGTFKLLEEPLACQVQECNCWRFMEAGRDEEWAKHWQSPDQERVYVERNHGAKVALIQAPTWGFYDPPIALAQLSSYLKGNGFQVRSWDINVDLYNNRREEYKTVWANEQTIFWCNRENVREFFKANQIHIQRYVKEILEFNPLIVAFSVNVASFHTSSQLARIIKKKNPDIYIVIGGPSFCVPADVETILNNEPFDIIVMGEGEETFAQVSESLERREDLSRCEGICFKQNGKITQTKPREVIRDLDELPFLDFSDMPLDSYDPPGHLGKHISLMTSRGCILPCVFCAQREYWPGFRYMSGKRIYDEIKFHIKNYSEIGHIEFLDLLINGNMKVLNDLCDLMISSPPKENLKWHANAIIRPQMSIEVCQKMKAAGCHHLTFGIESGSQRVLDLMRKYYRVDDADRVLKNVHEAGIVITCNFMFGFPGETEGDFQQTLDFVRRNAKSIDTAYPSRSFCTIEPHSYMEKHMDELGIAPNPVNNTYWESKDGQNNYPERVRRCEEFSLLVDSLGVAVGSGLGTSVELDRYWNLGHYYESKKDYRQSLDYFSKYLELDPKNKIINERVKILKANCLNEKEE